MFPTYEAAVKAKEQYEVLHFGDTRQKEGDTKNNMTWVCNGPVGSEYVPAFGRRKSSGTQESQCTKLLPLTLPFPHPPWLHHVPTCPCRQKPMTTWPPQFGCCMNYLPLSERPSAHAWAWCRSGPPTLID